MGGPLEGLLVVTLEQAVAAPLCTMRLADAGARVIKIERAEGDFARGYDNVVHGESSYFVWLNRGKASLVVDIKDPNDAALLHRIIRAADVFVQNLAPGAAERAGFDSTALRAANPKLITCDISGFGDDGPFKHMKAYDLLIQCETGLADITGGPTEPSRVGVSVADICCGMNAHAAILEALVARHGTGQGSGVVVTLFDGIADWMTVPLLHQDYGGKTPSRIGIGHPSIAPYSSYTTSDDKRIILSVQNEREWISFCTHVLMTSGFARDEKFITNVERVANRAALDSAIGAIFSTISSREAIERLERANIAYGSLNSVAQFSKHPQLRRMEVETPSGPAKLPASPFRVDDGRPARWSVPSIGEQTSAIRAEFSL